MTDKVYYIYDKSRLIGHTTPGTGGRHNIFIDCRWFDPTADEGAVKFFGEYENLDLFNTERGWNLQFTTGKKVQYSFDFGSEDPGDLSIFPDGSI